MTIADELNAIAVAQGGTASTSGTIAGAIDALNDALAGSDQDAASTIEDAVRLLGQHIGGASPTGTIEITENGEGIDVAQYAYADVNVSGGATVGELVSFAFITSDSKSGDYVNFGNSDINSIYLGESIIMSCIYDNGTLGSIGGIAAGVTIKSAQYMALGQNDDVKTYLVTVKPDPQDPSYEVIDTITPLETDSHTYVSEGSKYYTITIPDLPDGAYLGIEWQYGD